MTAANLLDEDNMASDSATNVPSQQSVKAYVDAAVLAGGDSLGSHTATTALDMATFNITNVGTVDGVDVSALDATVSGLGTASGVDTGTTNGTIPLIGDVLATSVIPDLEGLATACADNKVLKASAGGWICADDNAGTGADNMGDHTATTALDMATFNITNVGTVDGVDVSALNAKLAGLCQVNFVVRADCFGN